MKKNLYHFLLVIILISVSGCASVFTQYGQLESSARKFYDEGDYDNAVIKCSASLQLEPGYERAQKLMEVSFRKATEIHYNRISNLQSSSDKFRWDYLIAEYDALERIYNAVKVLPPIKMKDTGKTLVFEYIDYIPQREHAVKMSAEAHYQEGMRMSKYSDKTSQRLAALEFKKSMSLIGGYKNTFDMYQKCKEAGTLHFAIIPFVDKSGKNGKYGDISGLMSDYIQQDIMQDPMAMEFLNIIDRTGIDQLMRERNLINSGTVNVNKAVNIGQMIGASHLVIGKITQIIHEPPVRTRRVEKKERYIITGKESYKDNKGNVKERDITEKVRATVSVHTIESILKIIVSYKIIDVETSNVIKSNVVTGENIFYHEWATYKGSRSAFGDDSKLADLTYVGTKRPPSTESMVTEAVKDLSLNISATIKDFLKQY